MIWDCLEIFPSSLIDDVNINDLEMNTLMFYLYTSYRE